MLTFLITIIAVPIAGCSNKKNESAAELRQEKIQKNRAAWDKKVKNADKAYLISGEDLTQVFPQTMKQLKKKNDFVIQGTIINYRKKEGITMGDETIASIYVDKVIAGSKSLKGTYIKTTLPHGFAMSDDMNVTFDGDGDNGPNTEKFYWSNDFPLPKIGSQIITGITSNKEYLKEYPAVREEMEKFKLADSKSYYIKNPMENFWVKNNKGKYVINNKDIRNIDRGSDNFALVSHLFELTKQLDEKY